MPPRGLIPVFLQIIVYGFAALGVASLLVWSRIVQRTTAGEPVLPFCPRERVLWEPVVVLTALVAWVAAPILVYGFSEILSQWDAAPPNPPNRAAPADGRQHVPAGKRGGNRADDAAIDVRRVQMSCISNALLVAAVLPLISMQSPQHRLRDYGVTLRGWRTSLSDGVTGFVASVVPVFTVLILTLWFRSRETQHPFLQLLEEHPGVQTVLWIALAAVVAAPLAEELVFRVVLQGWLQTRMSPRRAILLVAIFFSAVHGWPDALPLFPLALILGYVYYRRYSYLTVVVLHALFNAANLTLALATAEDAAG